MELLYLTQMVNFRTWIPGCDSQSPTLLGFFLFSNDGTFSTMAFPSLGNSDHVAVSVFIDFPSNPKRDASFYCIVYDFSRAG